MKRTSRTARRKTASLILQTAERKRGGGSMKRSIPTSRTARGSHCHPILRLRTDLCTPSWKLTARGILLESKDDIRKRLGRSPGKGDAVVMAWSEGNRAAMARAQKKPAAYRPPSYSSHPQAWMG